MEELLNICTALKYYYNIIYHEIRLLGLKYIFTVQNHNACIDISLQPNLMRKSINKYSDKKNFKVGKSGNHRENIIHSQMRNKCGPSQGFF